MSRFTWLFTKHSHRSDYDGQRGEEGIVRYAYLILILTGVGMARPALGEANRYEGPSHRELSREGEFEVRDRA